MSLLQPRGYGRLAQLPAVDGPVLRQLLEQVADGAGSASDAVESALTTLITIVRVTLSAVTPTGLVPC